MDAWLFAMMLSQRHPSEQNSFYAIANTISNSRIVAGVHFLSDTKAGKVLAMSALHIIRDYLLL